MTQSLVAHNAGVPTTPAYLQNRNAKLAGASATIVDMEQKPVIKMDKGLWLCRNGEKVDRLNAVVAGADGVQERIPDVCDFIILGFTDVIYSYFQPGQALGGNKPLCFSVGGTVPHAKAPNKQSNVCKSCAQNKDGSGQNGKGKACSKRRIVIGFRLTDPKREIVALQVPTLSVWFNPDNMPGWFGFNDYVTQLNKYETPAEFVITRILVDGSGDKPRMNFSFAGYITEDIHAFVTSDAPAADVKEFRDYFEFANMDSAAAPAPATAAPVASNQAVADSLYAMMANPATAPAAAQALMALGLPLVKPVDDPFAALRAEFPGLADDVLIAIHTARNPAAPLITPPDPLAALRSEFPGVPDAALVQIKAAREAGAAPVVAAPVVAAPVVAAPVVAAPVVAAPVVTAPVVTAPVVAAPVVAAPVVPTPPAMTVQALPAVVTDATPQVVNASPDSDEALAAMTAFIAGV